MTRLALAIDIGGTNTKFALVSNEGVVKDPQSFRTQSEDAFDVYMKRLKTHLDDYLALHQVGYSDVMVGVGVPNYTSKKEMLISPPNLSWGTFPLKKAFQEVLDCPVYMENDANVAAIGEGMWGSAKGLDHFAVVTVGTGIGTGIFVDGHLVLGSTGQAAEGGHLIVGEQGEPCLCGGMDHFESYCSVGGMKRYILKTYGREMRYHDIIDEYHKGCKDMRAVFERAAKYFARGLHQLLVSFSPSKVILAGGGMAVGEEYLEMIKKEFRVLAFPPLCDSIELTISNVSISSGAVLGAAALAFDRHSRH